MFPRKWLHEKGMLYVGLLAASTIGIALLIAFTAMVVVDSSFEPIVDPAIVSVMVVLTAVAAHELSKSDGNENGS